MSAREKNTVSIWNWIGTLFLCAIPGINILTLILTIIFTKAQPKRSFAIGALIVAVLLVLLLTAAFMFLPDVMQSAAEWIRGTQA